MRMEQLTPDMVLAYTEYLKKHSNGVGPLILYGRFKKGYFGFPTIAPDVYKT